MAGEVRNPKSVEVAYRKSILQLSNKITNGSLNQLSHILTQYESEYVKDAYSQALEEVFERLRRTYAEVGTEASRISNSFVSQTNSVNKRRFYNAMNKAIGVDLNNIVQNEGLDDLLRSSVRENVSLIRSIPEEYFKKVEGIVYRETVQGSSSNSIISQLKKLGKITDNRAKLIARDQTSKLNSNLNQQRQRNLGIEKYVWRTSKDDRVRESHKKKNGKIFFWNDPPSDTGHPGEDIQCRCIARPIIKF